MIGAPATNSYLLGDLRSSADYLSDTDLGEHGQPTLAPQYRVRSMKSARVLGKARGVTIGAHRKHALIVLGLATVAFTVTLELLDPSHVSHGPNILDFEFAGSHSRAAQMISEWGSRGRRAARLSLVLDYGYMFSYGLFFALAGFVVRDTARARGWLRLATIGTVIPFFALVAAGFDASENVALLLTLGGNGGNFAPPFAAVCSAIKFTLITIAILYALCGLLVCMKRTRPLRLPD